MSYTEYLNELVADMRIVGNQPPKIASGYLPIILADCVTPEIRGRKHLIEFPIGIDSIGQFLMQLGYPVDYTFLPPTGFRRHLRSTNETLQTLGLFGNSRIPVRQANILGISMMNYLQTPYFLSLLSLSGIPLYRKDRTAMDPLIVLGGHIWPNPLPLSEFYDVMVIGDGEEVMACIAQCTAANKGAREEQCSAIAAIPGVYVPSHPRGPIRRVIVDFTDEKYAAGSSIVKGGTAAVVLSRGCMHACAFCNSGLVGGPYRVKPRPQLIRRIDRLSRAGARRIMLCAIAAASYRWKGATLNDVVNEITSRGMEVRSMSDRPESFGSEHLKRTAKLLGKVSIAIEAHPEIREKVF
jgi:hypothetical protein